MVAANSLFSELLARKIAFYRQKLPVYASVIHQGGAPEWAVARWLDVLTGRKQPSHEEAKAQANIAVVTMLREAVPSAKPEETTQDAVARLLDAAQQSRSEVNTQLAAFEPYGW